MVKGFKLSEGGKRGDGNRWRGQMVGRLLKGERELLEEGRDGAEGVGARLERF